nr:hypothetical protein BaRGS_034470 [Batillaria attramentaria]
MVAFNPVCTKIPDYAAAEKESACDIASRVILIVIFRRDCPDVWQSSGLFCYKFVGDTPLKVDDAAAECSYDGAGLLYVDSVEENTFIRNWLETNDPFQRTWLTSGHGVTGDREVGEDYGLDVEDVNALDRGPHFVLTPHSVVVVSETGEQAFLECLADAKPEPVYKWFRGDIFEEEMPDEISDAGDYRCQVSNKYGTIVSSSVAITFGSVRYQWLKDTAQFIRTDFQAYIFISNNGKLYFSEVTSSTTPFYYSWRREGLPIPASAIFEDHNRVMIIRNAQLEDSGTYTCDVMSPPPSYLWYKNGQQLTSDPDTRVVVARNVLTITNLQAELHDGMYQCGAFNSHGAEMSNAQLRITWLRNGGALVTGGGSRLSQLANGNLIISDLQQGDAGQYTCQAENEFGQASSSTVLNIAWPPGMPGGVMADQQTVTKFGVLLMWTVGDDNGGTVTSFQLEAQDEFHEDTWTVVRTYIKTLDSPPAVSPRNVRGGGGSVGDLTLRWDAEKSVDEDKHVALVGEENYYLLYQVKVQALNVMGQGPNSSIVDVYSAEGMPVGTPTNVQSNTFNSTALEVSWEPVPDTREVVKGKIVGYQINYWPEELLPSDYLRFIRYYGQRDTGLVIGLDVDVNTWVDVQVYNSAGLGPRSEAYIMETSGFAPLHYPEEVRVYSAAVEIEVPMRPTEYTLEGLDTSILYALRIAGVNGGGYGRKSPTQYFTFEGSVFIDYAFSQTIDVYLATASVPKPCSLLMLGLSLFVVCNWLS